MGMERDLQLPGGELPSKNCHSCDDSRVETGLVGLGDLKIGQGPIKE